MSRSLQCWCWSEVAWCRVRDTECSSACMGSSEGSHHYPHFLHHSLTPGKQQGGFPGGSEVKPSACNAGDLGSFPGSGRSPGKEMATHSSILAWRIPWMEEPGGLQSMGHKESDTTDQLNFHFHFQIAGREHSSTHPQKIGLKIY